MGEMHAPDILRATCFDSTVGVFGKSALFPSQHRCLIGPRPAPKRGAAVIGKSLLNFSAGIHHERPMLRDRLIDRLALQ